MAVAGSSLILIWLRNVSCFCSDVIVLNVASDMENL